jgi:6-phosphogluconolactonase
MDLTTLNMDPVPAGPGNELQAENLALKNQARMGNARGVTMKLAKRARLLLAVIPFLAGCGNFWQAPSSSSGGSGTTSTTLSSGYFYVINQATSQIVAYDINAGSLNQIAAYTLSASPTALAMSPGGGFLYVSTVAGIYLYNIGSGGALTLGNNGGVVSSDPASAIEIDPSGAWLVDAVEGTSGVQLDATPINSSGIYTGATVGSEQYALANASVHQMAISGDDHFVFIAAGEGGTLVVSFTSGNDNPLASGGNVIPVVTADGSALSVAADPGTAPRVLYVGETLASAGTAGGLRVFNYSSIGAATLTQVAGSPFASGGLAPSAILPLASGDYVYVGNGEGTAAGNIDGFSITTTSGATALASVSTVPTGVQPSGLAEDSDSNFLLAVSIGGSADLECYTFDSTTAGKLDDAINSATGTDPTEAVAVAAAP